MGGGPSASERARQARLDAQEEEDRANRNRLVAAAERPDPVAERMRGRVMRILDWNDRTGEFKDTPRNVESMPGLETHLDLFNRARVRRQGERLGVGALALGEANPQQAAALREMRDTERETEAAGALENAVTMNLAEATGSAMPWAEYQTSKALNLAGLGQNAYEGAAGRSLQFLMRPRRQPFWQQLLMGGMQAGSQLGAAAIMAPGGGI